MKHPGDPTPAPVDAVRNDRRYKTVSMELTPTANSPRLTTIIVMHCGTETYWQVAYDVFHYVGPMTWQQVEPVIETRTTYRPVASSA